MNERSPIAFILGLPGQLYLAKSLAEEFGRPVIGITTWGRTDEFLTPESRKTFQKIYSLPDYYLGNIVRIRAMSRADLDKAQNALEKKLGIANSATISYYDRALRWCGDYMKVRHYQLAVLELVDRFFEAENPAFVMGGVVAYLQHALHAGAKKRDIPFIITMNSRLNGRVEILHEDGQCIGFRETFAELQKGNSGDADDEILNHADAAFDAFLQRPVRPAFAVRNSAIGLQMGKIISGLKWVFHPDRLFPSEAVLSYERYLGYEYSPARSLLNGLRNRGRRLVIRFSKIMSESPDLDAPFIYMPLHYTPENSDMYFGSAYDHHAGFVTQLARSIPAGVELYVKEHPSMAGCRPAAFYRELNRLYNVRIIAPSVDTFTLIKKSRAVITVTGTAGWEGFLMGKPVVALGNVFYNSLPGILHAPLDKDFSSRFSRYLEEFNSPEPLRRNAFRAFHAVCPPGTKGDLSFDISETQAASNARKFARGIRTCIEKWGHTMAGKFPEDILSSASAGKKRQPDDYRPERTSAASRTRRK